MVLWHTDGAHDRAAEGGGRVGGGDQPTANRPVNHRIDQSRYRNLCTETPIRFAKRIERGPTWT